MLSRFVSRVPPMQLQSSRCLITTTPRVRNIPDPMWEGKEVLTHETILGDEGYSQQERRCGVLATKIGMTADWDKWGRRIPLTALQIMDCRVTQVKTPERDGVFAMVLGAKNASEAKRRRAPNSEVRKFDGLGMPLKTQVAQFNVTEKSMLPLGTTLTVRHFLPGQYLDVCGTSRGKGFQGVMKRHGMKGGPASHGCSKAHRRMGGTGGATYPGRIFKGKKMAGHMGSQTRWQWSLWLYKMNTKYNILFVKGCVPGAKGSMVKVMDARRKVFKKFDALPYPTYYPKEGEEVPEELIAPVEEDDPEAYD